MHLFTLLIFFFKESILTEPYDPPRPAPPYQPPPRPVAKPVQPPTPGSPAALPLYHATSNQVVYGGSVKRPFSPFVTPHIEEGYSIRRVQDTDVNCQKNHMIVTFTFSAPFSGYIYIYEHFPECILFSGHLSERTEMTLHFGPCGQKRIDNQLETDFSPVIEHRLMVQWERDFICEDDTSVIVRCERPDDFNKTINWRFGTLELDATLKKSKHPGPKMWMTIQRGEGPNAPPLDDEPVFIGDVLTIVFTLSDNVFWFGSNILSCVAIDAGDRETGYQYVENEAQTSLTPAGNSYSGRMEIIENECSTKPKIFSHFYKERNEQKGYLVTTHYAHFKAFRFPTSKRIRIQCDVRVCYKDCADLPPCSTGFQPRAAKRKRSVDGDEFGPEGTEINTVPFSKKIVVYSTDDSGIPHETVRLGSSQSKEELLSELMSSYCYTPTTFYGWISVLGFSTVILLFIVLWCYARKNDPRMFVTPKH